MVNSIEVRGYSSSVMTNLTYRVRHHQFVVDMDMMIIFIRKSSEWVLDTIDYGGVTNLVIDGVIIDDENKYDYFKFLEKIGLDYERECTKAIEKEIEGYTQEQIVGLMLGTWKEEVIIPVFEQTTQPIED
jgi:hypothetical protein